MAGTDKAISCHDQNSRVAAIECWINNESTFTEIQQGFDSARLQGFSEITISSIIDLSSNTLSIPEDLKLTFNNVGLLRNGKIKFSGNNEINAGRGQIFDDIVFQIFKEDPVGRVIFKTLQSSPKELDYINNEPSDFLVSLQTGYIYYQFGDVRPVLTGTSNTPITENSYDARSIYNIAPVRLGKLILNNEIYPEWFGALPDTEEDVTGSFQSAIDLQQISAGATISVSNGVYNLHDRILYTTKSGKAIIGCLCVYGFLDIRSNAKKGRNSEQPEDTSPNDGSVIVNTNGYRVFRRHPAYHHFTNEIFPSIRDIRFNRVVSYSTYAEGSPEFINQKKILQSSHLFHHMTLKSAVLDNITASSYGIVLNGNLNGVTSMSRCRWTGCWRSAISGRGYSEADGIYGDDGYDLYRWVQPFTDSFISNNYFNAIANIYTKDTCCFELHGATRSIIHNNFFDFWSSVISAPLYGAIDGVQISNNTFDDCYRLACPYHVLMPDWDYSKFVTSFVGGFGNLQWLGNNITNHRAESRFNSWHSDEWILFDFSMREAYQKPDGSFVRFANPAFQNTVIKDTTISVCNKIIRLKTIGGNYNLREEGTVLQTLDSQMNISDYFDFQYTGLYGNNRNRLGNYFESYNNLSFDIIPFTTFAGLYPKPNVVVGSSSADTITYNTLNAEGTAIVSATAQVSKSFVNQRIWIHGVELTNDSGTWKYLSGYGIVDDNYAWASPGIDGIRVQHLNNKYTFKSNPGNLNIGNYFWESGFDTQNSEDKTTWFSKTSVFGTKVLYSNKYYTWNGNFWQDEYYNTIYETATDSSDYNVPIGNSSAFLPTISQDRHIILSVPSARNMGERHTFYNRNTSSYNWKLSIDITDGDDNTISILPSGVTIIYATPASWRIENIYRSSYSKAESDSLYTQILKGIVSGNGLTLQWIIPHEIGAKPTFVGLPSPRNQDSGNAGVLWVDADDTNIIINTVSPLPSGTNNGIWDITYKL